MKNEVVRCLVALLVTCAGSGGALANAAAADDYQKASELLSKKSYNEAVPLLDKAIQADSKHSEAYLDRALCNFHLGNYKKVVEDCNQVISNESANQVTKRQAYMMSAGAHNALGEFNEAVQSADKAISLSPKASLGYSDRAFAYKQLKRYDEALRDVAEAIKLDPKHASNYEMRAAIYEAMAKQDRDKQRELLQARKPGEKPWEKSGKSGDKTAADSGKH